MLAFFVPRKVLHKKMKKLQIGIEDLNLRSRFSFMNFYKLLYVYTFHYQLVQSGDQSSDHSDH